MSEVEIVVDGSCLGNPGPGGWACILRFGDDERVLHGGAGETTNNRMELSAAIEGLRALNRACRVTVLTDSEYLRRGITEFLPRWKENGWRNSAGKSGREPGFVGATRGIGAVPRRELAACERTFRRAVPGPLRHTGNGQRR